MITEELMKVACKKAMQTNREAEEQIRQRISDE